MSNDDLVQLWFLMEEFLFTYGRQWEDRGDSPLDRIENILEAKETDRLHSAIQTKRDVAR